MSRCFPFPPPGYEQKVSDSVEVVIKEKHRSKKDKKEKREKEKKEGKEKKHRDKSREKHGEKKDRKDRDRDRDKKDKDKKKDGDRKRERGVSSNEKSREEHAAEKMDGRTEAANANDSKFREELQSRIRDEKGAGRIQMDEPTFSQVQGSNVPFEKTREIDYETCPSAIRRQKPMDGSGTGLETEQKAMGNRVSSRYAIVGSTDMEQKNHRIGHTGSSVKETISGTKNRSGPSNVYIQNNTLIGNGNRIGYFGGVPENDGSAEHKILNVSRSTFTEKDSAKGPRNHLMHSGTCGTFTEKDSDKGPRNHSMHSGTCSTFTEKDSAKGPRNHSVHSGTFPEKDGSAKINNHIASSRVLPGKDSITERRNHILPSGFLDRDVVSEEPNRFGPHGSLAGKAVDADQRVFLESSAFSVEKNANIKVDSKEVIAVQGVSPAKKEKQKSKEKKSKDGKERHKDRDRKKEKDKTKDKREHKDKDKKHTPVMVKTEQQQQSIKPVLPSIESVSNASHACTNLKSEEYQHSIKSGSSSKNTDNNACSDGINLKRKEVNGLLLANELRPVKLQKTAQSPQPQFYSQLENGRNLECNHVSIPQVLEKFVGMKDQPVVIGKPEAVNARKISSAETKEQKVNGSFQHQITASTISKPLLSEFSMNEVRKKSPHPDTRYLSRILSVPKMAEWPEVDDQNWLFGLDDTWQKPRNKREIDKVSMVWDKPMKVEGDGVALPYVIPY